MFHNQKQQILFDGNQQNVLVVDYGRLRFLERWYISRTEPKYFNE